MAWFHAQKLWNEFLLKEKLSILTTFQLLSLWSPIVTSTTAWSNAYNLKCKRKHLINTFYSYWRYCNQICLLVFLVPAIQIFISKLGFARHKVSSSMASQHVKMFSDAECRGKSNFSVLTVQSWPSSCLIQVTGLWGCAFNSLETRVYPGVVFPGQEQKHILALE